MTPKQKRFVDEYLIDCNASAAARRAGYSARTADAIGRENLGKPTIAAAIAEQQAARAQRTQITQDRVLEEYAKIAFLDPRRFYDSAGNLLDITELPKDVAAALAGIEVTTERAGMDEDGKPLLRPVRKIKFADKRAALDSLARHLGMFVDRKEVRTGLLDDMPADQAQAMVDAIDAIRRARSAAG